MKKIILIAIIMSSLLISGCTSVGIIENSETSIIDERGNSNIVSVFGDQVNGKRVPFILAQFQYNIASKDVTVNKIGTGNIVQDQATALLYTGTGLNSEIEITSVDSLRYIPGQEGYALFTSAFISGGVTGVKQRAGLMNRGEDGYFLGYDGTIFEVGLIKNGVEDTKPRSEFTDKLDGTGESGCDIDLTKLHIYRISYGWLGIAPINFEVYCNEDLGFVKFASIDKSNLKQTPTINNPVLKLSFYIEKKGVSNNVSIRTASWNAGNIDGSIDNDKVNPASRFFSHSSVKTIIANTKTNIITLNSTDTFFGKNNKIDTLVNSISISSEGNKPVTISIDINCDLAGTPNFINEDVNNSVILIDVNSTSVSNCQEVTSFQLAKTDSINEYLANRGIIIKPGDILTISATSTQTSLVSASIRWEELF